MKAKIMRMQIIGWAVLMSVGGVAWNAEKPLLPVPALQSIAAEG